MPLHRGIFPVLYHGTNARLLSGDMIVSSRKSGFKVEDMGDDAHDFVWLTPNLDDAKAYANTAAAVNGGKPHVYKIRSAEYLETMDREFIAQSAIVDKEI